MATCRPPRQVYDMVCLLSEAANSQRQWPSVGTRMWYRRGTNSVVTPGRRLLDTGLSLVRTCCVSLGSSSCHRDVHENAVCSTHGQCSSIACCDNLACGTTPLGLFQGLIDREIWLFGFAYTDAQLSLDRLLLDTGLFPAVKNHKLGLCHIKMAGNLLRCSKFT